MNSDFHEFSDLEVRKRIEGDKWQFYDRYTNSSGFKFYMFRFNDIHPTKHDYQNEWFINFLGFFKENSDFDEKAACLTFGVAENYIKRNGLGDDDNLRMFLFQNGELEFRHFLDNIDTFDNHDETIILRWGDDPPIFKNGKILSARDVDNDSRLLRIAEVNFAKAILENNGFTPLRRIDFLDICFVPNEYLTHVERRYLRPEFMDVELGILTPDGKNAMQALLLDTHRDITRSSKCFT